MTSAADCQGCSVGTYCPVGSAAATNCSAGTYNEQPNQETCTRCAAGTYQDAEGATACKSCSDGHYCPEGAASRLPCARGTWSAAVGLASMIQCQDAEPGHFATTASPQQSACRPDTYNPTWRASSDASCKPCPLSSTTNGATGRARLVDCICTAEYYNSAEEHGHVNCSLCPSGSNCNHAGISLAILYL